MRYITLTLAIFFTIAVIFPFSISAQENTSVLDVAETSNVVTIDEPLILPDTATTLQGTAEPGATITVFVLNGQNTIYTQSTKVSPTGQWSLPLPAFTESPTQLNIRTEVELTAQKIIETATVGGAVATSAFVLIQLVSERLFRVLQLVGLWRRKTTKGFVYDIVTNKPIPFALLTIRSAEKGQQFQETVVSTVEGFFKTITLPRGKYVVDVAHPEFTFPVDQPKPWYAPATEFYTGEAIVLGDQQELEILFIPMQSTAAAKRKLLYWLNIDVFFSLFNHFAKVVSLPMGIVSIGLVLFYPSFINFVISITYVALGLFLLSQQTRKKTLSGKVTTSEGKVVEDAVVRIYQTEPHELVTAVLTDTHGAFHSKLDKGTYQVLVSKPGLVPVTEGISFESVELQSSRHNLEYKMALPPENPFLASQSSEQNSGDRQSTQDQQQETK